MAGPYFILLIGSAPELPALFENLPGDIEWIVEQTTHVEIALERLRYRPFDLVLADHRTPALGEVDSLRAIQRVRPATKVIILVSDSSPEKVIDAMGEHAFSYFSRPFDAGSVKAMILQALAMPEWDDGIEILSARPNFLSLDLRCRMHTADRLIQFMQEFKLDLPDDERTRMAMAFRELLMNAIEHGGKLDPNEKVRVSRIRTRRTLVYHITDPGQGFEMQDLKHAAVSNPPNEPVKHLEYRMEQGMRAGGFGMLLAKELVDEVIYNERGNEVVLIKYLD